MSWNLAHQEITGIATAGDVLLLGEMIAAERDRMDPQEAEALLLSDLEYRSRFASMPAGL